MFLMMPSLPQLHKMVCSAEQVVGRDIDKKYLQMKSSVPLVLNQNGLIEMFLMLSSTEIDQKVQLG